ncbi:phosphotriesterase-related protein [Bradyrhizobium elkanii]|nr:phosphotriesterase-related protein [Bradyrhizobium elkanii]
MMVETVTGPIPVERLGRTLMHEHLFIAFPGSWFDPLAKYDRAELVEEAVRRLVKLRTDHDVLTFVDPCPIELGRDVNLMKEVSEKSGVQIVCTTGFYYEQLGLPVYWRARTVDEIAELYIREITHGIGDTGVKAGAIKVSTSAPVITEQEKKFLAAACIVQKATGIPIITHTTDGCAGPEQQELFAAGGVAAHRCLIGHCCCNVDPAYHRRIVDAGSYIGFDQIGMFYYRPDEVRADNLAKLVRDGFRAQIIMSMDRLCGRLGKFNFHLTAEYIAKMEYLKSQGLYQAHTYVFTDFIPMLHARGVSQADIDSILEDNPRRFFAGEALPERQRNH